MRSDDHRHGRAEIVDPVEGWNPVPGDPDSSVFWDGSTFTHEAIRAGDGWEVLAVPDAGVAPVSVPSRTGRRWSWWVPRVVAGAGAVAIIVGIVGYLSGLVVGLGAVGNQDWDDHTGDDLVTASRVWLTVGIVLAVVGLAWWFTVHLVRRPSEVATGASRAGCGSAALVTGLVVVVVLGVLFSQCAENSTAPSKAQLSDEIASWRLPATLRRVAAPNGFDCEERLCRYYEPLGVDAKTAARDLVRSLNRSGYDLSLLFPGTDTFWADFAKTDDRCELDIDADVQDRRGRALVEVSFGEC